MSYNNIAQTNLIPKELYGTDTISGSDVSMSVSPTGIILGGDLNTDTPITATISQAGIITDNPNGFNILSSLNLNSNNITKVDNISSTSGNSLTITGDGGILMNSTNTGMNFTASVDDIEFNCNGNSIYLNSNIDIGLNTTNGTITLNSIVGDIQLNAPSATITASASADIALTSTAEDIDLNAFANINLTALTGINILSPLNMNSNAITNVDTISSTTGSGISITGDSNVDITASNTDITISAYDGINISSITSGINLSTNGTEVSFTNCPINMNSNDITDVININSTIGSGISITGDANAYLTAGSNLFLSGEIISISNPSGFTNSITLNKYTGDTSIASAFGSVNISSGNGDAGASSITLFAPEGDIVLNTGVGAQVSSNASITSSVGYTGKVFHTDQPTTALTYYLTFVQSGGVSGYYDPAFDSATLTYNPSTNLLSVSGLQLSGATINGTFTAGVLTLGCNEASSRQFQLNMTANITGLTLTNRRTNGVYTCSLYNVSGSTWTISNVLSGSSSNKTDYLAPISVANGEFAVLTARTLLTNGTSYNYVSVAKFS
jgi:uncharacterized protein (DUF2345 family)